jgi:hypothetical protein
VLRLCAEGIPIFSSIPRQHSSLSVTPHSRPSPSLDTFLRAFLPWALRHKKFNYDENQPTCSQVRHFAIAVYTVRDKGPSQRMRRLLAAPFRANREEVPSVVAERNLQQVRLYDVTVPHEALPNPETIAEQNRHLITSMSPRARSASVTTSSVRMQGPFLYPTPLDILRHMVLRSCHRLLPLETRSQQGSMVHPCAFRDTSISASCLTAVNA